MGHPIALFERWFDEARAKGEQDPEGVTLATCTADGAPSARIVLYRGMSDGGFRFFSNYRSRKGDELAENARAALLFWFRSLARQVRVEGTVERLGDAENDAYFAARPRGHQLSAWASEQSQPIAGRTVIEARFAEAEARFAGKEVARPAHWGGYRVRPLRLEFWTGREDRMHERQVFVREGGDFRVETLAP